MLAYIKSILPRLQKYSKHLDKVENFIGKEWLLIDENGYNHSYEFLRDGRLIMTLVTNGGTSQETQVGSWELLPTERLLITRVQGQLTLRQGFIGDGLLILQESGTTNIPFNCYDPKVIQDGDVENYLRRFIEVQEAAQITSTTEVDGAGNKVYRNPDGSLYSGELIDKDNRTHTLVIKDGLVISKYCIKLYDTDKGSVKIKIQMSFLESDYDKCPVKGDNVSFKDGSKAIDGVYKFTENSNDISSIVVANGLIEELVDGSTTALISLIIFIIALFLLIIFLVAGKGCN